jgi:hypothetical protein
LGAEWWSGLQSLPKSVLAEGTAQARGLAGAVVLIDKIIAQIEQPGWEERHYYAEALRMKRLLLWRRAIGRRGARLHRLARLGTAATGKVLGAAHLYARWMRDQGRVREAYDLLAPVYAWFTEGFATKDLKDAKPLLEELETTAALAARVARLSLPLCSISELQHFRCYSVVRPLPIR